MSRDWLADATTPEQAVRLIRGGHHVFLHGGCATSLVLENAFAEYAKCLEDVTIFQIHKEGGEPMAAPELAGHVRIKSLFTGAGLRSAINEGRADYVPVFLSDIPHYMRNGIFPIDVAVVQLSYPDQHGYCSLGVSVDVARQAVDSAAIVIAEINQQMPRTFGTGFVHMSELDAFVLTDHPIIEHPSKPIDDVSRAIGSHVAELVQDGATIQLGIGAIPSAVLSQLTNKRDLGVHTEVFTDALIDLIEAGVITNKLKTNNRRRTVSSFLLGVKRTYDYVHDNPSVRFYPSDQTNDTSLIRDQYRMTAINSALEVDITGQVCADSIGTRIYSGIGGQMDFIRGAALAKEGRAIIALPSTAKGGQLSRIVPALAAGAGVVTTRGHVQFIVTEFGVADLRGKSLRERAEALTAIAHPDHRADLRAQLAGRKLFV
jgi:acyl-CoA hydrolase